MFSESMTPLIYYLPVILNGMISIAAFATAVLIFRKWKKDRPLIFFGWNWLMVGCGYLANVVFGIFIRSDMLVYAKTAVYFTYLFVVFQAPFLVYFLIVKSTNREKLGRFVSIFIAALFLIFTYILFSEDLVIRYSADWGVRFSPSLNGIIFVAMLVGIAFFLAIFSFLKIMIGWIRKKHLEDRYLALSIFSVVIFVIAGYFESRGTLPIWLLRFVKLAILGSVLMSFIASYFKPLPPQEQKQPNSYEI